MQKPTAPADSAEAALEPKTCALLQRELRDRGISAADFARKLSIPVIHLEAAFNGERTLKIGTWRVIATALKALPEYYQFRQSDKHNGCWEIYNVLLAA